MHSIIFFLLISLLPSVTWAQKGSKVDINADSTFYFKRDGREIIRLQDHVVFVHEGVIMKCDSAYYYLKENSLDAFSNIHVNQGDTVHLYGEKMFYDGNTKKLRLEENVRFRDKKMTLESHVIHYDRTTGTASYDGGGNIKSEDNNLYSKIGSYNSHTKWFTFKDSVVLLSPKYKMSSDTLLFHPESGMTRFRGPSLIESDSGFIRCSYGDYDTKNDIASFSKRAFVQDRSRTLIGDSIYYNRSGGKGKLYGDVYIADTVEKYIIRGQYAEYIDNPEYAFVTGFPLYTMLTGEDSVHIHGDTLKITTDLSGAKKIKVFPNARIYKPDLQGKCDSITYLEHNSTMYMYEEPVLWNGKSQLTADHIYLTLDNNELDSIFMIKNAFILTRVDSIKFDQVRGKDMYGNFIKNELRSLRVIGNGQTVYTVIDKGVEQGINRADCSDLIVRFKDSEVYQVVFITKPNAKMYPTGEIPKGELFLKGFNPRLDEQPKSKSDLFKR